MSSTQKHYLKVNPYLDIISGIAVVLSFSDGIIKIIGREGSGKSVLCNLLSAELMEEEQEVVIFPDIPHSEAELHGPIQKQLHLNLGEHADFYVALNRYIQARPFDQQKLILVFDDADQIPEDCFQAIRVLFEKNNTDRPEVSMVFAGSELLDQKLNEPANKTFNKNIILNFEVKPMNRSELEAFCNAYLVEVGLKKHQLAKEDLDDIHETTRGLPGQIPELIFSILDREEQEKKAAKEDEAIDKGVMGKLVKLDDDPEPELAGLSVEDREEVLTAFKDQVPWRWQSNGVSIAVVVLFIVVAYGYFVPVDQRGSSIVIFPPPPQSPGQLSASEIENLDGTLFQQQFATAPAADDTEVEVAEVNPPQEEAPAPIDEAATDAVAVIETGEADEVEQEQEAAEPAAAVEDVEEELTAGVEVPEPAPEPESEPVTTEPEQAVASTPTPPAGTETDVAEEPVEDTPAIVEQTPTDSVATAQPDPAPVAEPEPEQITRAATPEPEPEPVTVPPEPVDEPATPRTGPTVFVNNWLSAWESRELNDYFTAYSAEFTPAGQESFAAWREDRTARINSPEDINIALEDFEIIDEGNLEATVRVQFTYQSPSYADRTVKELVLAAENGDWAIREERNVSVEKLATPAAQSTPPDSEMALAAAEVMAGESGFEAKIRQVLALAGMSDSSQLNSPLGSFINDWIGAWKDQDVEGYFRHYDDSFQPAYFESMSDWRADRIRKIHEKRFIDIALDDIEVLDEDGSNTRIRFWLSYASSFYLDRTLKEVVVSQSGANNMGILQERNLEVEIIPFYP